MGIIKWLKNLGSNTLYYPGCLTKAVLKKEFENYKEVFNILGIDFIVLQDKESCCGMPVANAGYVKDVRRLIQKNLNVFREYKVRKIITNCPSCYHTFKNIYPEISREWKEADIEIEHATITILNALKKKGIEFYGEKEKISYHDPCHLGRYSGIYEEPREVIRILGGEIIETTNNRENAMCCGGGGGVQANFPDVAKKIAKEKLKSFSEKTEKIISPCGLCYLNIKSASEKSEEFSEFVLRKLKGGEDEN